MNWNKHFELEGAHAFLGASKYHWVQYTEEKLDDVYSKYRAAQRGTELHDLAANLIRLGVKLEKKNQTLNLYVNDAIGFRMTPEVTLWYSDNCFGTADAIGFRKYNGKQILRIHDLKTGVSPASIMQLRIYAALFCLEYREDPNKIDCELRIYQDDQVFVEEPESEDILYIMQKIRDFNRRIQELREGE